MDFSDLSILRPSEASINQVGLCEERTYKSGGAGERSEGCGSEANI